MPHTTPHSDRPAPARFRQLETSDDRWLADLPNDLGAISLSSDEIPTVHTDEMGLNRREDRHDRKGRHDEIGI